MPTRKLRAKCQFCAKPAIELRSEIDGKYRYSTLQCGHTVPFALGFDPKEDHDYSVSTIDGKKTLFPFQVDDVQKAIEISGGRCLFNHEMGLGKTPMGLAPLKVLPKEYLPAVIFCKSKLKAQWLQMLMAWCGPEYVPQVIETSTDRPLPKYFKVFIISLDLLRNLEWLNEIKARTVIIDEVQLIKNPDAKRTKAVQDFCRDKPHLFALSGTPIKNNAGEYYVILNLLRPEIFHSKVSYLANHVSYEFINGKFKMGGLQNPENFRELTKDFIFRRTREEVMPDLPKVFRQMQFCDVESKEIQERYDEAFEKFDDIMSEGFEHMTFEKWSNVLTYLTSMRHLAGLAKIEATINYVSEFLFETDRKLVLFVHHRDVGNILNLRLTNLLKEGGFNPPIALTSDMSKDKLDEYIACSSECGWVSKDPRDRIVIASTLAFGEGFNWQACQDMMMVERQWNPANEKQAEDRFPRIGSTAASVNAVYMCARGTIDEWFAELVERKRSILDNVLDGKELVWNEQSLMRELAMDLYSKGRTKWKLM